MSDTTKLSKCSLTLNGKVVSDPKLVTKYGVTKILRVELENKRTSGAIDRFNVHFTNKLGVVLKEGMFIELTGDIRSVNDRESNRSVYPFVMAHNIRVLDEEPSEYKNECEIEGAELCEFDGVRKDFSGGDKLLATYRIRVTRKHGRYSYFRVTTWGKDAVFIGNIHNSVKFLHLKGRLQSYVSKASNNLCFGFVSYYLEVQDTDEETEE